jgi:hypothetical protein
LWQNFRYQQCVSLLDKFAIFEASLISKHTPPLKETLSPSPNSPAENNMKAQAVKMISIEDHTTCPTKVTLLRVVGIPEHTAEFFSETEAKDLPHRLIKKN